MGINMRVLSFWRLHMCKESNFALLLAVICSLLSVRIGCPLPIQECGVVDIPKNRIVGGHRAQDGAYPWMVSLEENGYIGCSGSILNEHWIVTAAHCIDFPTDTWRYTVYVGVHKLSNRKRWQSQQYRISRIIVHEDFNFSIALHDIALLRTWAPMDLVYSRGYVKAICLPETEADPEGWAIVTGWGITEHGGKTLSDELKTVKVPILPREMCNAAYENLTRTAIPKPFPASEICAGASQMSACKGDSGGPLIQRDIRGVHTLIGIVSYGRKCGDPKFPAVYTKVASYKDWIEEKIQN